MKNKLNTFDYIVISLISLGFVCLIYHFLYDIIGYSNLKDFYVGTSIYENHNKYLDLLTVPVYVLIFFIILPIYSKLPKFNLKFELPDIDFQTTHFIEQHKLLFMLLQTVLSFGYIVLHPFYGNLYLPLAIIILILIVTSIIHSYICLYKKERPKLSVLGILPIFILLFGNSYNLGAISPDMHHEGEKLAVWLMNSQFKTEYYKDVMMVHGFADIIPPLLGYHIFGEISVYSAMLGRSLFDNLMLILTVILSYNIFIQCPILVSFTMFRPWNIPQLYILSFLTFLKAKKNFLWIIFYILFAMSALFFQTTYGSFWLFASLPLTVFIAKKHKKVIFAIVFALIILLINKNFIYNFSQEAVNYIQSNLYAFGNNFSPIKLHQIFSDCIKLFAFLALPYFIINLFAELKNKDKNTEAIFLYIFAIVFVLSSISYSLGRIDYIFMRRIRDISLTYLGSLIPFLFLIKHDKNLKYFKYLSTIAAIYLIFTHIGNLKSWFPEEKPFFNTTSTTQEIKIVLDKYSVSQNDFLDLNHGMNYFIFNKKMPVPYTSFYNVVNSKQNKKISSIEPNVILLETDLPRFDNVYPSLRINELYRNLILNPKYSTLKTPNNLFLIKHKGQKDLQALDKALATDNLYYLPDVWYNSIKTLPLKQIDYKYKINNNIIELHTPVKGENIDLIELNTKNKNIKYSLSINGSNSVLNFQSKQFSQLVPFDNFPSWLLNKNLKTITVQTDKPIEILSVRFYKKMAAPF